MTMQFPLTRRSFTRQLLVSPALAGAAGLAGPLCSIARAQTTRIQINVTSRSPQPQNFFFFQQPANYIGGARVYSNSLFNATLPPYNPGSGAQITFKASLQFFAGVQNSNTADPPVGQLSGYNTAWVAIALQEPPPDQSPCSTNFTHANGTQLALSVPVPNPAVRPGFFRISSPIFNPVQFSFNAGSATLNESTGTIVLSNFVLVTSPNIDCQPILKYYVHTGAYTPGTVMNFIQSSRGAAVCDATNGKINFNVVYKADGTWALT
jgi:hypothetical protein